MKPRFIIPVLIAASMGHLAVNAQGFRGIRWSATQAEVVKKEGKPNEATDGKEGHRIYYRRLVAGISNVSTSFEFKNNKLHSGTYIFDFLNRSQINDLFKSLVEKYAKPKRVIRNDRSIEYQWIKNDTRVTFNKFDFSSHVVHYFYNPYFLEMEKENRKKRREGL
jgi:hypothetical protein